MLYGVSDGRAVAKQAMRGKRKYARAIKRRQLDGHAIGSSPRPLARTTHSVAFVRAVLAARVILRMREGRKDEEGNRMQNSL